MKSFVFGRTIQNLNEDFAYQSRVEDMDGEPDMEGDHAQNIGIGTYAWGGGLKQLASSH